MNCVTIAWAQHTGIKLNRTEKTSVGICPSQHRRVSVDFNGLQLNGEVIGRSVPRNLWKASVSQETETPVWEGEQIDAEQLVNMVKFNEAGLVPAIAQQYDTGEILMMAWMSAESIRETMRGGRAVYYSRSRKELWRKGDTSGQVQVLNDIILDCDGDTILVKVDQLGVACHTGRRSCFYTAFRPPHGEPEITMDVLMDPKELYGTKK